MQILGHEGKAVPWGFVGLDEMISAELKVHPLPLSVAWKLLPRNRGPGTAFRVCEAPCPVCRARFEAACSVQLTQCLSLT